jgi:uncharacterized protein YpuA (DUF1002 family)
VRLAGAEGVWTPGSGARVSSDVVDLENKKVGFGVDRRTAEAENRKKLEAYREKLAEEKEKKKLVGEMEKNLEVQRKKLAEMKVERVAVPMLKPEVLKDVSLAPLFTEYTVNAVLT